MPVRLVLAWLGRAAERAVIPLLVTTSVTLVLAYATEDPPPVEVLMPAAPSPSLGPLLNLPSLDPSAPFSPFPNRDGGPRSATPSPFPTPIVSPSAGVVPSALPLPTVPPLPTLPPLPTPPLPTPCLPLIPCPLPLPSLVLCCE